jgi:hypothetical protein
MGRKLTIFSDICALSLYDSIRFPYYSQQEDSIVSKEEKLFSAEQGAFMTRMALSSFRTKVSKLKIKGTKQGVKVLYTRRQLESVYYGVASKPVKTVRVKKVSKKTSK